MCFSIKQALVVYSLNFRKETDDFARLIFFIFDVVHVKLTFLGHEAPFLISVYDLVKMDF